MSTADLGAMIALRPDVYRLLGEFDGRRTLAQIYAGGAVAIDVDNPRTLQVAETILASRNSIYDEANVRMSLIGARGCGLPVSLSGSSLTKPVAVRLRA